MYGIQCLCQPGIFLHRRCTFKSRGMGDSSSGCQLASFNHPMRKRTINYVTVVVEIKAIEKHKPPLLTAIVEASCPSRDQVYKDYFTHSYLIDFKELREDEQDRILMGSFSFPHYIVLPLQHRVSESHFDIPL